MAARRSTLLVAAALQVALSTSSARADDPFERCEQEVARHPETYESSLCFYQAAAGSQRWELGRDHLRRLGRAHPDVHWPTLCLGYIEYNQGGPGAEDLFHAAAEGFAAQGVTKGEVLARLNLGTYLVNGPGRVLEAEEQIRRATAVAELSGDRELQARALVAAAQLVEHSGADLEGAYRGLRRVESLPDVPLGVRSPALHLLGNMALQLGRHDEAIQHYRALARLLGDTPSEALAGALHGIANGMLEKRLELPIPGAREEILAAGERAVRAGIESGSALWEAISRALVARLLASDPAQRDAARRHLDLCLERARMSREPQRQSECLWDLSELEAERDPVAAAGYIAKAIEIADQSADRWFVPFAWRHRTMLAFRAGPRDQAVADGLRLLDVIETFRELQSGGGGRAGVLSRWAGDYYRVSGELLRGGRGGPSRHDLELGFQVVERLRARVLLDRISSLGAGTDPPANDATARERHETLEAISQVHRQLLRPEVKPGERDAALRRLEVLESREADLRDQLARSWRSGGAAPSPRAFARLEEVQRLLAADEALLSFQVGLWRDLFGAFEGGAWLLVVTRDDVRAHAIPDRAELEAMVPTFAGLFAARDGREAVPAAALYGRLLSPALEALPPRVTRLVIIPDGRLHQLPFPALRVPPATQPLGLRYALSVVPSATVWASWRRGATRRAEKTVWAFADPVVGSGPRARTSAAEERSWLSGSGAPLGPLPHARQEGERLVETLGGEHVLLIGADASEHALKAGDPGSFAVLHLAAHAVIDDEHPERSAVLLAPGDDAEDGLLQPREISELDLAGRVVVLSGCRTASGKVIQGEGVLSLARAFFEAGATAVVGSLWPLRDDEAAIFFGHFYTRLGQGERLDRAVQLAQEYAVDRGAPSAAWAGLVVLGDGSAIPFPGGRPVRGGGGRWIAIGLSAIVIAAGAAWVRRRGRRVTAT